MTDTKKIEWTGKMVGECFEEAVYTLKRLPRVKVQGYFSVWPEIVYTEIEILQQAKKPFRLGPPLPDAIDRMEETLRWILWLKNTDDRHLIWLRARHVPWRPICCRLGVDRTTAWRRHTRALERIAGHLNKEGCE